MMCTLLAQIGISQPRQQTKTKVYLTESQNKNGGRRWASQDREPKVKRRRTNEQHPSVRSHIPLPNHNKPQQCDAVDIFGAYL